MENLKKRLSIDNVSKNTRRDILMEWSNSTSKERVTHMWVNGVGIETKREVRRIWECMDREYSLYDAYCKILNLERGI